jgi:L-ascorbate metabolism protein UlaG (beta-lactamase superfamily)
MNRRKILKVLSLPFLAMSGTAAWASYQRGRNPYYNGPVSANFDGLRFSDGRPVTKGFADFFRWQLQGGAERWPAQYDAPAQDRPPAQVQGLRITHIGHASFLLQTGGVNLLIDPVFSERASPVQFAGPKRANAPGVAFDDLPKIDAVLITHNHYDHLDVLTLARLQARDNPRMIMPLGNDTIIRSAIPAARTEAHDWEAEIALSGGSSVRLVPSYHWSARGALDRRMALWASFIFRTPVGKVYHIGDTGYHDGSLFKRHGKEHGPFRLAILPIGAYEPRWFMSDNHMDPHEAVQVMQSLGAQEAIGHHWGTFQLTNEGIERPLEALDEALRKAGVPAARFSASRPGQVWEPGVA